MSVSTTNWVGLEDKTLDFESETRNQSRFRAVLRAFFLPQRLPYHRTTCFLWADLIPTYVPILFRNFLVIHIYIFLGCHTMNLGDLSQVFITQFF